MITRSESKSQMKNSKMYGCADTRFTPLGTIQYRSASAIDLLRNCPYYYLTSAKGPGVVVRQLFKLRSDFIGVLWSVLFSSKRMQSCPA
jgi:hypothetical protein